jgi:hypothetical protein
MAVCSDNPNLVGLEYQTSSFPDQTLRHRRNAAPSGVYAMMDSDGRQNP